MTDIKIAIGRTKTVAVSFGRDISGDTITSQIRAGRSKTSAFIAEWVVTLSTDGLDGEAIFTLDNAVTAEILPQIGYMDIKEIKDGEPLQPFDNALEVEFYIPVTE